MTSSRKEGSRSDAGRFSQLHAEGVRKLRIPAYATAALFVLVSLIDMATLAWPINAGAVAWRFGTVGAASNYVLTLFFGAVLACWTAAYFAHVRTLRVLAVLTTLMTFVLILALGDFLLSALQLRGSVPQGEALAFRIGTIKASVKYSCFALGFLLTGIASWRAAGVYGRRA